MLEIDFKKGNGLVVCGSNDTATQEVVFAINAAIGAMGTTVNTAVSNLSKKGNDADMNAFVAALKSGAVGAVVLAEFSNKWIKLSSKNWPYPA
jgi:molybdopterin-containing oxidoreductase family iron-sulfur binding subunit